ncbi:MAG: ABC transporter permease [Candidatus Parvarchaeota archaeon]
MSPISDFWHDFKKNKMGITGLIIIVIFVLIAVLSPFISPYNPNSPSLGASLLPPSIHHLFGTNEIGEDLFSRDMYGAKIPLEVGFVAAAITVILGLLVGLISGYFGGIADEVLMRITDFFIVVPVLIFMIIIAAFVGSSLINVILIIGLLSWAPTARIVRSMVISLREWPFVEVAKANNAGPFYIIFRHIMPNVIPLVFATATLAIANAIFAQTSLAFLGVGNVNAISWGSIMHFAFYSGAIDDGDWWYIVPPGVFIILLILAFIMISFSLEDIFNPRLKKV